MTARALLAACALLLSTAPARAITIDDFAVPYPGTGGGVFSDGSGVGTLSQPGIAVLGGTRDTRVTATLPASPSGVTIIANPSPPPVKNVLEAVVGGSGGDVRLGYPGLTSYDLTLGGTSAFPSSVEVMAALMVAGGTVELTLTGPGGVVAADSLPTADFSGGSPSGLTKYAFFPGTASFPGVDLTQIDELAVRVALPTGADFELSEIRVVPVASAWANWDRSLALEPAAGSIDPRVLVGFNPQPEPPGTEPEFDLSDPRRPRISWVMGVEPEPFFELIVGAYGGLGINPCVAPGAELELELQREGVVHRLMLEISSSDGQLLDPASVVGFNPQPEPPGTNRFAWSEPIPEEDQPQSLGLRLGLMPPMLGAAGSPADHTVTLSFQVLDESGDAIALVPVSRAVPALPAWLALALAVGLIALATTAASRRATATASPSGGRASSAR